MKLFSTPASPFARKVRAVIAETGLNDRVEEVDILVTPVDPHADLARHNPAAKVPTLVTGDGEAIFDSRVICEYLDGLHNGERLFPAGDPDRHRALTRQAMGDAIMDAGVLVRYEQAIRPGEKFWQDWQDAQLSKALRTADVLEGEAATFGSLVDIGMIAVASALDYLDFRFSDLVDWREGRSAIAEWHREFTDRPSMRTTRLIDPNAK